MKNLKSILMCWALCLGALLSFNRASVAQCLTFDPNPGTGTVSIVTLYWEYDSYTAPQDVALFQDTVLVGNSTVPAGTYLGWCIDLTNSIAGEETNNVLMYSSCDPNLDSELTALGAKYHFSYPATDTTNSASQWNEVNYILNHKPAGAYFYDIQCALWSIVGGPLPPVSWFTSQGYPAYNPANVQFMVTNAEAQAGSWQPTCGDVLAVLLAITNETDGNFPVQLTIIECPIKPTLTQGSIGCYTSLAAAEAAAIAATSVQPSGTPLTATASGTDCDESITVTATGCSSTSSVTYTTTILTSKPTFSNLPPATTNYTSTTSVPAAPNVTAKDSCGNELTVNYTSTQTNPNSSCDDTITRVWTATDCAGQTSTFTETITVTDSFTQTTCGNCGFQQCNGGYLWCNAQLCCSPGKDCTVYCQNASVTLTCRGKTCTYSVPDCQVNFSSSCRTASCNYQGGNWCTTVPCQGDSQIFLSGCGIPWQSCFANCSSISWTGTFCCSTPGVNCKWVCGASCYNANLGNCGSIQVKPCYQNNCGFNNNDCAGTPENCKSYCQNGNNYCGSWSNSGSFTCR